MRQGAEVVLRKTSAKIGVSPAYAVHISWDNPDKSDGHRDPSLACTVYDAKSIQYAPRVREGRGILVNILWYPGK